MAIEHIGKYKIKNKIGHLNIRLIKNIKRLTVKGRYPQESYCLKDKPIQQIENQLKYVNTWYLHTTHLHRSTSKTNAIDRRPKTKFRIGRKMTKAELPQVLFLPRPDFVPAPPTKPWHYFIKPK